MADLTGDVTITVTTTIDAAGANDHRTPSGVPVKKKRRPTLKARAAVQINTSISVAGEVHPSVTDDILYLLLT